MKHNDLEQALGKIPQIPGLHLSIADTGMQDDSTPVQLVLTYKGSELRYNINRRSDLNTTAVGVLATRLVSPEERAKHLLYVPIVNTTCGERLRQHGINFIDDFGHVFLQAPDLYLFAVGRVQRASRTGRAIPGRPEARAFKTATLKLIYAFLADPALDKTPGESLLNRNYREIVEGTGLALGSVSNAMDDLMANEFVIEQSPGKRMLVNRRKLFERWVQDYGTRLRPKLVTAHFRAPNPRWWQTAELQGWGGFWGGEVAGARLTDFLTPETSTIYAEQIPDAFILEYDLRKDPAGGVELLRPFWRTRRQSAASDCVHPIVVYADLAATDIDRNLQTAQRIYERHIRTIVEST
jgi:hypothetical protein